MTVPWLGSADRTAAAAAAAAATVMIAVQIAGKATRDALFLSTFGVAALPPMIIAAAVLSGLVLVKLARVMAESRPGQLIPRLLGLSALLLLAEWILALQVRRPAAVLVYLHFTGLGAVLISGFWAIVNERFDPRTARRTIGWITGGGSLGSLLGGLLPDRVGASLSLATMLPIIAGLQVLAALFVLGIERGAPPRPPAQPLLPGEDPTLDAGRILRSSPYLRNLALLVALTATAEGALDYVFKARAAAATSTGEDLLRLFAAFYTVTALLGIFIQVSSLRTVLARLGIVRSAAVLPAGVSVGSIVALFVPGLASIMLARGAEVVLRSSLFRAAYELLFTPVESREKRATKLLLDVGSARVGDVVGAALIQMALVLTSAAAGQLLLGLTVALSLAALAVTRRLQRGYVTALEGSLQRRAAELPDPIEDDAAALLQTVGGFNITGLQTLPAAPVHPKTVPPADSAAVAQSADTLRNAVAAGDVEAVRHLLSDGTLARDETAAVIELLAWDRAAPYAIAALRRAGCAQTPLLLRHLLDPEQDFAIRRRLVSVVAECRSVEAFEGLFKALRDRRFEVRFRAARALSQLYGKIPGLTVDRERVFTTVLQEMRVERGLWESRQLIDLPDDESSPMEAEVLRDRANRSLEHLFTLLSLVFPRETLRIAFHGLHTDDPYLRGTALEYLETVLPEQIWGRLWPFLNEGGDYVPRRGRASGQAVAELLASRESILLALGEARARAKLR
jgi:ATP:ADP antiporter, AAA family